MYAAVPVEPVLPDDSSRLPSTRCLKAACEMRIYFA